MTALDHRAKDRWTAVVARALAQYDIARYDARLIRHGENLAYEVTASGVSHAQRYLLRIHSPSSANLRGIQHTFEGLNSEVAILQAFRRGTGIPLQQPVANRHGRYVTAIPDPSTGESHACTLLTWVEGETPTSKHPDLDRLVAVMACQAAAMHRFARSWQSEAPLIRPVYDEAKYLHLVDKIGWGLEAGLFSGEQYGIVRATMDEIATLFAAIPHTSANWGIIHADLSLGNLVLTDAGELVPIDFCFAGYGFYLFDVGGAIPAFQSPQRRIYLDAYQQAAGPFGAQDLRLINACFLLSIFGAVGFHVSNPAAHEWIARRMPIWTGGYCRPFMEGRSLVAIDA